MQQLATRVDRLVDLAKRPADENRSLRQGKNNVNDGRSCSARNEMARSRVESMISRLKSLESNRERAGRSKILDREFTWCEPGERESLMAAATLRMRAARDPRRAQDGGAGPDRGAGGANLAHELQQLRAKAAARRPDRPRARRNEPQAGRVVRQPRDALSVG